MPIEKAAGPTIRRGWIEFDVTFLAQLFGLTPTGEARVVLGKIQVGVQDPRIPSEGAIVEGLLTHAIVPTGVRPKAPVN